MYKPATAIKRIKELDKEFLPNDVDDWPLERIDEFIVRLKEVLRLTYEEDV